MSKTPNHMEPPRPSPTPNPAAPMRWTAQERIALAAQLVKREVQDLDVYLAHRLTTLMGAHKDFINSYLPSIVGKHKDLLDPKSYPEYKGD